MRAKIAIEKANEYQTDLLAEIMSFKKHTKPTSPEKTRKRNSSSKLVSFF